jgi:hypothetical protein
MNAHEKRTITLRNQEWEILSKFIKRAAMGKDDTGHAVNEAATPLTAIFMVVVNEFERQRLI